MQKKNLKKKKISKDKLKRNSKLLLFLITKTALVFIYIIIGLTLGGLIGSSINKDMGRTTGIILGIIIIPPILYLLTLKKIIILMKLDK